LVDIVEMGLRLGRPSVCSSLERITADWDCWFRNEGSEEADEEDDTESDAGYRFRESKCPAAAVGDVLSQILGLVKAGFVFDSPGVLVKA